MTLRTTTARLLLFAGALVALLLLAELALWVSGRVPDPGEFRFRRALTATANDPGGRYRRHPTRFYELAPHFHANEHYLGRDATGEWPFRGRPPEPAPPGLRRVVLVGDSCVYGASLPACDMLATQLAAALAERGLPPDKVAVISMGVPGYSTLQMALLLDEALALRPDAIVLYPAAWNDQAPALRGPDSALLASLAHPSLVEWLADHSRLAAALVHVGSDTPLQAVIDGWEKGRPPLGWRVPADEVGPNVARMLARCADSGVPAVVIAPPHPEKTMAEHPRTAQDAAAVLAAARQAGVPALDGQSLFAAGGDLPRCFSDYVHPSPDGIARLVPPLADALAPLLAAPAETSAGDDPLRIVDVAPREGSRLGDIELRVTLEGWSRGETLPAVIVGGAPLLGLFVTGAHEVTGMLMANGARAHDVVVQTTRGCAVLPGAVTLRDPAVRLDPGPPAVLHVEGGPGDRLRFLVGTELRAAPQWSNRGASWLANGKPFPQDVTLDAAGRATLPVPPLPEGRVSLQMLVTPRQAEGSDGSLTCWSDVVELTPP